MTSRHPSAGAGFDGRLLMIGSETERPYERPPLSNGYVRGEEAREDVYRELLDCIEVKAGRMAAVAQSATQGST